MKRDVAQAFIWAWLAASAVGFALALAPVVLPNGALLGVFPRCSGCFLCGMTTAFDAIGRGDLESANSANRGSVLLYSSLVINGLIAGTYAVRRFFVCRFLR